jgi:hypothetical protein
VERYDTVESLLGSNFPLPDALASSSQRVDPSEVIAEYESGRGERWDGIEDAFAPVRGIVEGAEALVGGEHYRAAAAAASEARALVSVVAAPRSWAFFCLGGSAEQAPRWILLAADRPEPTAELATVARELRARLAETAGGLTLDPAGSAALERWTTRLARAERAMLPRRMHRALEEMRAVLDAWIRAASARQDGTRLEAYRSLQQLLDRPGTGPVPDWEEVASRWLEIVRPVWYEQLQARRRRRPLLLRDIRAEVIAREAQLGDEVIDRLARAALPAQSTPAERVVAAIVGMTEGERAQAGSTDRR